MDLIVYGATGFTGQKICHEITKHPLKQNLTWTIAGRSLKKLTELLESLDLCKIPKPRVVVVDIVDIEKLRQVISQYRVCINCVGPFRQYGRPVFEACVLGKTDYVDICGETEFIEQMYSDYNQMALEREVALVPACGYDSVPADFYSMWTRQVFDGVCTQMEMFVQLNHGKSGLGVNATTFTSAVLGFASVDNLRKLRKKSHRKLNYVGEKLVVSKSPRWNANLQCYTMPLQVADIPVMKLGQQMIENHKEMYKRGEAMGNYQPPVLIPVQLAGYCSFKSWIGIAYLFYLGLLLTIGSYISFFRDLLIKYPAFLTLGVFTTQGPSQQQLDESSFETTFIAKGYSKNREVKGKPDVEMVAKVQGPEMGYVTTPICVVTAAKMLLSRRDAILNGVLTPSVAFINLAIEFKDTLEQRGIRYSILSKRSI